MPCCNAVTSIWGKKMKTATIELDREWSAAMRLRQIRSLGRTLIRYTAIILACVSVLVMGSESQWFPWPNLSAGAVLFFIAWRMNR